MMKGKVKDSDKLGWRDYSKFLKFVKFFNAKVSDDQPSESVKRLISNMFHHCKFAYRFQNEEEKDRIA